MKGTGERITEHNVSCMVPGKALVPCLNDKEGNTLLEALEDELLLYLHFPICLKQ